MADRLVAKKYRLGRRIGTGSFGEVYIGTDARTGETYAMKLEHTKRIKHPQLAFESKVFKLLQGGTGIPKIHHFGKEGHYNVLVMQRLGTSLEELFHACGGKFSVKTVLMIVEQALSRLEYLHSKVCACVVALCTAPVQEFWPQCWRRGARAALTRFSASRLDSGHHPPRYQAG